MKIKEFEIIKYQIGNVIISDVQAEELIKNIGRKPLHVLMDDVIQKYRENLINKLESDLEIV